MLKALIDLFKINRKENQQTVNVSTIENAPAVSPVVESATVVEPAPAELAPVTEPIKIQDEIKIEKESTPKRGRPKAGSKPKLNKKK